MRTTRTARRTRQSTVVQLTPEELAAQQTAERAAKKAKELESAKAALAAPEDYDFFAGRYFAKRMLETAKKTLDDWKAEFEKNPAQAMGWSLQTFEAAADFDVLSKCIRAHENGASDRAILQSLEQDIERYQPRLSGSTSPASNLMETAMAMASHKIAKELRSSIRWMDNAQATVYAAQEETAASLPDIEEALRKVVF
jgi:hypothetical protein